MGVIGTFGDVIFEVRNDRVFTFKGPNHTAKGRWAVHDVMQGKPKGEFLGPGQNEMEIELRLSSQLGVNPRAEFEKIGTMILQGRHAVFMLGEKPIGNNEWYADEMRTDFVRVKGDGTVEFMDITVSLKEYF